MRLRTNSHLCPPHPQPLSPTSGVEGSSERGGEGDRARGFRGKLRRHSAANRGYPRISALNRGYWGKRDFFGQGNFVTIRLAHWSMLMLFLAKGNP